MEKLKYLAFPDFPRGAKASPRRAKASPRGANSSPRGATGPLVPYRGDRGWMGQKKKEKGYHKFHYLKNSLNQIICMHLEAHYLLYCNHIFNYFFSNYTSCCNFFNEIHFFLHKKKPGVGWDTLL